MRQRSLSEDDLPALTGLGPYLRPPIADGVALEAPDGTVAAAGWLREASGPEGVRLILDGVVLDGWRGQGLGARLLGALEAAARERAAGRAGVLRIEVVDRPEDARALYAAHGYRLAVQEQEMESATAAGATALPPDVTAEPWRDELAGDFHAVYWDAFRERPGFPGWDQATWTKAFTSIPEFRPGFTLLLRRADVPVAYAVGGIEGPHGFVVQMGVRPQARGRGLGEALLRLMLARYAEAGLAACRLEVATNNESAARLYRRVGFTPVRTIEVWRKDLQGPAS